MERIYEESYQKSYQRETRIWVVNPIVVWNLTEKGAFARASWFPATILTISTSLILLASLVVVSIITLATVDIPLTTMKLDAFVGYVVRSEVSVTRKIAALTGHQHQMDSKFITMHY